MNLNKPLSGVQGYKRLARLVTRAFYNGDLPPRDEEGGEDGDAPAAPRRLPKHTFEGLAIILVDYLTSNKVDGYVDEATIAADLRLSQKNIRKTLRYLEGEHLVSAETVKLSFKRSNIEVDDVEVEEKFKRKETRVFWCMDYARLRDALQLRILKLQEVLKKHTSGSEGVQLYICPQCGSKYSSLDAASLLDMTTGIFRCEVMSCSTELVDHFELEGPSGTTAPDGNTKERVSFFKGLQERVETQLKPIVDQLERIKETDPPDVGSLQDWYQGKKEEAERRAKRLEAARKRAAASSGQGAQSLAHLTEDQLLEWAERAEVVVALPDAEGGSLAASTAAVLPGKEVPAWFRHHEGTGVGGISPEEEAERAEKLNAEEQRRILEQQYLQQYLAQVRQVQQQVATGGVMVVVDGDVEDKEQQHVAKRMKVEEEGGQQQQQPAAKKEEEVAWEDVGNGDEEMWEDA